MIQWDFSSSTFLEVKFKILFIIFKLEFCLSKSWDRFGNQRTRVKLWLLWPWDKHNHPLILCLYIKNMTKNPCPTFPTEESANEALHRPWSYRQLHYTVTKNAFCLYSNKQLRKITEFLCSKLMHSQSTNSYSPETLSYTSFRCYRA